jgi:hypothetical protein
MTLTPEQKPLLSGGPGYTHAGGKPPSDFWP